MKDYSCSPTSWAGTGATKKTTATTIRYKDRGLTPSQNLPALLSAVECDADGEARRYVDLGSRQHCDAAKNLYDIGVLTRFAHTLVAGDELIDCNGVAVHVSADRPDKAPEKQGHRGKFRVRMSPRDYIKFKSTARHFKYGFMMTYVRDSNYQMFVVVDLTRWWYLLKLVEARWSSHGGPGSDDTVAIVVSGTDGGSAEKNHSGPGGSSKTYISIRC